jgi:hypothetical protein
MLINWYVTNIDPERLPRRLRTAYGLWLSLSGPGQAPSLEQVRSAELFADLEPYIAVTEGRLGDDTGSSVFVVAGSKVVDLFGRELVSRRLDEIFGESGRVLAEETAATVIGEGKAVHISVAGSEVISNDIQVIQAPLRHDDETMYRTMVVYDF